MTVRAASHESNDSLKENSGLPPVNTKSAERGPRGKRAAMREHIGGEADPEDSDKEADVNGGAEEEEDGAQSPKGRKRVRVNAEGDSRPTGSGSKIAKRGQTLPRDIDGFIPGSIVRIQLRNFLTYDWVEFRPGPYLNMIFGPNGTGKSSIACAICLGLNFPPSVLGRAQDLKSFVKNDREEGHIEIELKGAKGKSNVVIRRMLHSNSKSAPFVLNGKSASGKEINARMAELNVQVSNLCTFLPQDRVAEFARMTPQQLLRETQRAAGNENLTSWHDTLISSGKELRQVQELVNADREQLKTMEERNANLERDVRRYEERLALEKRIGLLELIVPFKQYYDAREEYRILKPQQKAAVKQFKQLEQRHAPLVKMNEAMNVELKEREKLRDDKKAAAKRKIASMSKKWEENEGLDTRVEDVKIKLGNLKKSEKNRVSNIKNLEKQIEETKNRLANPPETEDLDEVNHQLKQVAYDNNKMRQRLGELQDVQHLNVEKSRRCKQDIDQTTLRLQQLESHAHQKLEALKQNDADCAQVVEWLRQNRHRFRMEVFEPAVLCVTVPNRAYVDAVEACFGGSQLRTFVAQCEEDYQLLNRVCVDTPEALGHKARINTWCKAMDESQLAPPPLPSDQLRALGFDGYAIDFISCPEGLKWFLRADVRLHRTAITLHPHTVDQNRAMEMAARAGAGGASYIVGRVMNVVKRSKYGKRLPQNATREIQGARFLVHTAADPQVKRDLDMKLAEAKHNYRECQEEEEKLSEEDRQIHEEGKQYKKQNDELEARKRVVLNAQRDIQSLQIKLGRDEGKLQRLQNAPSVDVARQKFKQELLTLAKERVEVLKAYVELMRSSIIEQEKAARAGLEYLQLDANRAGLASMCQGQTEAIEKARAEAVEINAKFRAVKDKSMELLTKSRAKLEESDEELRDKFQIMETAGEIAAKSSEAWQADLAQGQEELEMNMATNANVVEQYKKRQTEIETLTSTVEDRERRILRIEQGIKTARDNWQPELEKLVGSIGQKFSAAFDRIRCAGEVRIREDEDYEKWAIDIMVKFRDHEKLQLLTGERQSGGERSLTTILYLMSLTEEARAPFSLVDEINQGMDQRAERAVHNSLVQVTCQPDSGQYFLITPKLLPDLNYHERMKILCVNNGEWLPEDKEPAMGNLIGLIDSFVRFRQGRANADT